jgi:hypothetical protein
MNAQKPSSRLGRTALMVELLGFATSAAMIAVSIYVGGENAVSGAQDLLPVYALGAAIAAVSCVWALVLAVRALRSGEPATLPLWVFNIATLPFAALGISYWFELPEHVLMQKKWVLDSWLPVILPLVSIAFIIATIVTRLIMRALKRRRIAAGKTPWQRGQRLRLSFVIAAVFVTLFLLPTLPIFMCVFAVINSNNSFEFGTYLSESSDIVRDAAEEILSLELSSRWRSSRLGTLVERGRVSQARLKSRFEKGDDETRACALLGAAEKMPEWASERALEVILDPNSGVRTIGAAEEVLAKYGSVAQRIAFLKAASQSNKIGDQRFFNYHFQISEPLVPVLKELAKSQAPLRVFALRALIFYLPEVQAEAYLDELWDRDYVRARDLILDQWPLSGARADLRTRLYLRMITQPDLAARRYSLGHSTHLMRSLQESNFHTKFDLLKTGLQFQREPDVAVRRGAALLLFSFLFNNQDVKDQASLTKLSGVLKNVETPASPSAPVMLGGAPLPETPEETAAMEKLRAMTEEWIAAHDKGKAK